MYNAINALINIPWAPLGMPPLGVEGWLSALQEAQERDVAGDNSFQERAAQACRLAGSQGASGGNGMCVGALGGAGPGAEFCADAGMQTRGEVEYCRNYGC